jgi:conjugal transfer mating pair stabilization protein TraG
VTAGPLGQVLDLIAAPESHGNYNAWYRHADQDQVILSTLTLNEVQTLQSQLLAQGNGGSVIGRYQILPDTLADLKQRLQLEGSEPFTPALQDRLALTLARDAGINDWAAGHIDNDSFAYNLSRIWAGLPKDASNLSYHDGVGGNAAQIDYAQVMETLAIIRRGGCSVASNDSVSSSGAQASLQ